MTHRRCRYCGSDQISTVGWREWMANRTPALPETTLIWDGAKAIAQEMPFCEFCDMWLPTTQERKQTEELIAALRLLVAVPELIGSRIEHADSPDLRLHLGATIHGLEVTRIVRGGHRLVRQAEWIEDVEQTARIIRRVQGKPPVTVRLSWNPSPPKASARAVARMLIDVVDLHAPRLLTRTDYASIQLEGPELLPDVAARFVHSIYLSRAGAGTDDSWMSGFSGNPDAQPAEIQHEIDRKARVAANYGFSGELWLLIYATNANAAQALDVTDEVRAATFNSGPFARVFFIDCMGKAADLLIGSRGS